MAVQKMQRMSICALKKDRKAILERLQGMGILEISPVLEEDGAFQKMDTSGKRREFEQAASLLDQSIQILEQYAPEKKSLFASLEGKMPITSAEEEEVKSKLDEILKTAEKIKAQDRRLGEEKAEVIRLENQAESLSLWLDLDVPMGYGGTEKTAFLVGTMPAAWTREMVLEALREEEPEITAVELFFFGREQSLVSMAAVCLKEEAALVEERLRGLGFARPSQVWEEVPAKERENCQSRIASSKKRQEEIREELVSLASERVRLQIGADYYRVRAEKYRVLGELAQTERTVLISGYIPKSRAGEVSDALTGQFDCAVDLEELKENEEAPVLLKNNPFSGSMEGVVESYGLPHRGEIDPTAIMSFFYVFFFGMMLSDAAYGLIVAAVCGFLLWRFPRMSPGMKQSFRLFLYCGISTLVWGILFGGYFGNIVDVVSEKFFGRAMTIPALWFVPLEKPMLLLLYSLLFGLIHLFTGLGIKGYVCIREKRYMDFFCDVILWALLLVGLILMLLPSELFASISQMEIHLPALVNGLAKGMAITGAAGILLLSGRGKKNPALRLALGAYDLYNITGWLSDVLSYSRLLALGLATGVIASVINQMASMLPNNVLGVAAFVVIFVVGHALNLAINLLGAYVHTNRLQFVEFFGKFYEGGGKPFRPFQENTKYAEKNLVEAKGKK